VARAQITDRLRWHAGLGGEPAHAASVSIAECTVGDGCSGDRVSEAVADVVAALGQLNRELNGLVPSETLGGSAEIPRDAAYAVAELIRMLRDAAQSSSATQARHDRADAAWSIETAWLAVLAGDIDDLHQHVAAERAMRGPDGR
jgi:hypothetical protein